MRSLLPILSVILALIAAGSIIYIAWELSSGEPGEDSRDADSENPNKRQDQNES
jgi:hypothetical protein